MTSQNDSIAALAMASPRERLAAYRALRGRGDPGAVGLTALAQAMTADYEADLVKQARAIVTGAYRSLSDTAADEDIEAAENEAWRSLTGPQRRAILDVMTGSATGDPPAVFMSGTVRHDPAPPPVIWRDADGAGDLHREPDSIVSPGEIAVLAGAGGAGKSWLAIRLSVEAQVAADRGLGYGATCGLRVRPGPVILMSYEMNPKRIDMAAESMGSEAGIPVLPPSGPLFPPSSGQTRVHAPGPTWRDTWKALADARPSLIVIDTVTKAMGGMIDANAPGPSSHFAWLSRPNSWISPARQR